MSLILLIRGNNAHRQPTRYRQGLEQALAPPEALYRVVDRLAEETVSDLDSRGVRVHLLLILGKNVFWHPFMFNISLIHYLPLWDFKMLKRTVIIVAAAAFFGGTAPTQTARADDDIWDLMDPSWWADEIFDDDDDDDWWRYRRHLYSPYYWGVPYDWYPPVRVIVRQPEKNPEIEPPE